MARASWHVIGKSPKKATKRKPIVKEQNERRVTDTVSLTLPMPLSANALFANKGSGGRIKTEAYNAWIEEAGWILVGQRPGKIDGRYELSLHVARPKTAIKQDLQNRLKAVSDLLVKHCVVSDDSLEEKITLQWSDDIEGVYIVIRRWKS